MWSGLPSAVPLRSLALSLAYYDSALGLAATIAAGAAQGQASGACMAICLVCHAGASTSHAKPPCVVCFLAGGGAAAQQWEPIITPLLLQACWKQLEVAWAECGATDSRTLRKYVSTGALAAEADGAAAGFLGAYLQLHSVPAAALLQKTASQVQDMLRDAQLPGADAASAAATAMLAATHRRMGLSAAQALAAALLH